MAEIRPFRGLRYTSSADPALTIAPPYDVISPAEQRALYERSPHNVVRIEYGEQRPDDGEASNRYTRAAADLARWRAEGVLAVDETPAIYAYKQQFSYGGRTHERRTWFVELRLEEWEKGVVKPHEHTLANPKADRLNLLRATRTQISPVYSLFRRKHHAPLFNDGDVLVDFEADGQRHRLSAIHDPGTIEAMQRALEESDVYIADGHHRYETALAYRDEIRDGVMRWAEEIPADFVLMGLTSYDDPGLLVLPTHRLVHRAPPGDGLEKLGAVFAIESLPQDDLDGAVARLRESDAAPSFVAIGLRPAELHLLTLRGRSRVEALMPDQPAAWKRLDVNVLQYGVLLQVFGIDDAALTAGGAVSYTQDAADAHRAVASGEAKCAFLLNATPVEQVLEVSDVNGRMPQKSTFFYPKLPTGLVMRALD